MHHRGRYFAAGALVAGAGVAMLLLGLPGVQAEAGPVVAVKASDYAYQGVPKTLGAGETRFSFTNTSEAEGHEMTLFRINDGVKESFGQILAEDEAAQSQAPEPDRSGDGGSGRTRPAEQAPPPEPRMTFWAATGAGPGDSARMDLVGNLPAGRYGIVCFLPVAGDESGTPHYQKGMKAEFTVR